MGKTNQYSYTRLCFIKSLYSGPIADGQNWPMALCLDVSDWLFGSYAWSAPYGWRFKTTSSPEYSVNADTNLEPIQGFPLAFDRNK
jgi:hypothetical protein